MVQIFYWVLVGADYNVEAQQLQEKATLTYRQHFPSEKTIIDIRSQAEGHLAQAGKPQGTTSFLTVLEMVGDAIQEHSVEGEVLVRSIQYKNQAGDVVVEVTAPSVAIIEQVRAALIDGSDLDVQTEQINQNRDLEGGEQGISARLRIANLLNLGLSNGVVNQWLLPILGAGRAE
jgi:type II secretory pathway component PulL